MFNFFWKRTREKKIPSPSFSNRKLLEALREATQEEQKESTTKTTLGGSTSWYLNTPSRYIEQCIALKYQRRTIVLTILISIATIGVSLWIAYISPIRQEKQEIEEQIVSLYRNIIANEEIFIANDYREFVKNPSIVIIQ